MSWICTACNRRFDRVPRTPDAQGWHCSVCDGALEICSEEISAPALTGRSSAARLAPADTVFQPGLMLESIMNEIDVRDDSQAHRTSNLAGTQSIESSSAEDLSPALAPDIEAFMLILGAPPGSERRSLTHAKTTVGRHHVDITLSDPSVSGTHFQIEAFGREFFVRDLDSRNGTYLNGTRIRYSQLLPGDVITAGKTTLLFRLSDDSLARESA